MSYTQGSPVAHWHSIDTLSSGLYTLNSPSGYAWASANMAIYVPLVIRNLAVVRKLWFAQSSTGATGNWDVGLYDAVGTKLASSGSTAKGSSSDYVYYDCTDVVVRPGVYYIALASNSATDTFYQMAPAAPTAAAFGVCTEASAFPLPATATFALNQTLTYIPVVGVLLTTVIS